MFRLRLPILALILGFSSLGQAAERVSVFQNAHVFFGNGENRRELTKQVKLPQSGDEFSKITLNFDLNCPNRDFIDRCDFWDRKGGFYMVAEDGTELEILRFVTPYRVGGSWQLDVTDLQPLLKGGFKTFKVFIDTWVGPGHPNGDGWKVDISLDYTKGKPQRPVAAVVPLFPSTAVGYGDPDAAATQLSSFVNLDSTYSGAKLWSYITGHGQANTENCAEFCPKTHTFAVNGAVANRLIWRENCSETVTDGVQQGTWEFPRAGWCPGDTVDPWQINIPASFLTDDLDIQWTVEPYINLKRTGFDGGAHTPPFYQVSAFLILYR